MLHWMSEGHWVRPERRPSVPAVRFHHGLDAKEVLFLTYVLSSQMRGGSLLSQMKKEERGEHILSTAFFT